MIWTLTKRPHIGCAVRWIYEIRDANTYCIVREQMSHPSPDDCESAVRLARAEDKARGGTRNRPVGGQHGGRRSRRASRVDLYNL